MMASFRTTAILVGKYLSRINRRGREDRFTGFYMAEVRSSPISVFMRTFSGRSNYRRSGTLQDVRRREMAEALNRHSPTSSTRCFSAFSSAI
jgi:hypothetical protein